MMRDRPLSYRAELLLGIVREATCRDEAGSLQCYFVPSKRAIYEVFHQKQPGFGCIVDGAGDAAILRALEKRGLIRAMPVAMYAYAITEDGIIEYERVAARKRGTVDD